MHGEPPLTKFRSGRGAWFVNAGNPEIIMEGSNVAKKRASFRRKDTPEERARMQNERRKRKRKARSVKNEENRRKVVLALEDERARTTAKNERLLYLARKYL